MKDMEAPGKSPNYEMRENIKYDTVNCLVCLKKAISWTGHVTRGNTKVIAGWCGNCDYSLYIGAKQGTSCAGEFKEEMGLQQLM